MRCAIRACATCSPAASRRARTCKARPACSPPRSRLAHQQITSALTPPGEPGGRDWDTAGPYARHHLAAHAAACGELDALASDPGFLLAADPGAVLAQRANLRTPDGKRALAAFDLSLHDWEAATPAARLDRLAANAARVHAAALTAACAIAGGEWPVRWAAWTGQGHRRLPGHDDSVNAVAIGRAGDRDVIVSGSDDGTVRVWDAVTGDPAAPRWPATTARCTRWRSGGPGTGTSSSPAPTMGRCGSGTRSPAIRPRPLAGHDGCGERGGDRAGRGPGRHRLRLRR